MTSRGNARQPIVRDDADRVLLDRPGLEDLVAACARELGVERDAWRSGRRSDAVDRSLTAYVCRNHFHHRGADVARVLGYSDGGSVTRSVSRVTESPRLMKAARRLVKVVRNG